MNFYNMLKWILFYMKPKCKMFLISEEIIEFLLKNKEFDWSALNYFKKQKL